MVTNKKLNMQNFKYLLIIPFAFAIAICTISGAFGQKRNTFNIESPNQKIKVVLSVDELSKSDTTASASLCVYYKEHGYTLLLKPSALGLSTDHGLFGNLKLQHVGQIKLLKSHYVMLTGKRKVCDNIANEQLFTFENVKGSRLDVVIRVYNNGIAFNYQLPGNAGQTINVTDELTTYNVPSGTERWLQKYDPSYEDYYPYSTSGKGEKGQQWGYPALFKKVGKPVYYLISEAGNTEDNCAARLNNATDFNTYKVNYPEPRGDFKQQGIVSATPWQSQWHTIIIGSLADVVQSTLITDVSIPSKIKDQSWIKPGAAAWVYWAYNHGSKDYKKVIEYIDLAKRMSWPYVLIDWEWDVMSNGGDIEDAVKYAKLQGVKPLLWYNSGTTGWADATPLDRLKSKEKREKEFQWLNKIGVCGVKVDFFAGDQQDMMKLYLDILKDAAKYHLLVDFHGATIPRGWARTYPNLMTVEAVYGAEWYNNKDVLSTKAAAHNTTLPFTRNVIGSMDYTPVTFSDSQHPHTTTYAHELALSVVYESALQNFADRPSAYDNLPEAPKNFLKTVPTTWDETKLIDGYPGKLVLIARRKGSTWYLAGLNGLDNEQTLVLPQNIIQKFGTKMHLIKDGNDSKSFEMKTVIGNKDVAVKCLSRGGFVGYFSAK